MGTLNWKVTPPHPPWPRWRGNGLRARLLESLDAEPIRVHLDPEPDRSGRGGLSQHARMRFVNRVLSRRQQSALKELRPG